MIQVLESHTDSVLSLDFSPEEPRLASASSDRTIRVWNLETGRAISTLIGHESVVNSVEYYPDGRFLVSTSADGTVRAWDLDSVGSFTNLIDGGTLVRSMAFSPDGRYLVTASWDPFLSVWNVTSGRLSHTVPGHEKGTRAIALSPDGTRVVSAGSGSLDRTGLDHSTAASISDVRTRKRFAILAGHDANITSLAFSPDGLRVASGSEDGTVRLWRADGGPPVESFETGAVGVSEIQFDPSGALLAAGLEEGSVVLLDPMKLKLLGRLAGNGREIVRIAFDPTGTRMAVGHTGRVRVWDVPARTLIEPDLSGSASEEVAFSPDGIRLVTKTLDGTIRVWDALRLCPVLTLRPDSTPGLVAWSPNGEFVASASFSTSGEHSLFLYRAPPP